MDQIESTVNQITGLTSRERKKVLSWVASLPETKVIDIFQDSVKGAYQIKADRPTLPGRITKYCAFILASRKIGWDTVRGKGYRVADDEQYQDFNNLRVAKTADFLRRGRAPDIRRKVLAHWGEVKEIKARGGGFRAISRYLAKERKIGVSASYLQTIWVGVESDD
jgi:hypothetical protein